MSIAIEDGNNICFGKPAFSEHYYVPVNLGSLNEGNEGIQIASPPGVHTPPLAEAYRHTARNTRGLVDELLEGGGFPLAVDDGEVAPLGATDRLRAPPRVGAGFAPYLTSLQLYSWHSTSTDKPVWFAPYLTSLQLYSWHSTSTDKPVWFAPYLTSLQLFSWHSTSTDKPVWFAPYLTSLQLYSWHSTSTDKPVWFAPYLTSLQLYSWHSTSTDKPVWFAPYLTSLQLYSWHSTNWDSFRDIVDDTLKLKVALKSSGDVDNATMQFTNTIQTACWRCTPQKSEYGMRLKNVPWEIRKRIQEKRRLRRVWHTSRCPSDKTALNKAMLELKTMIKDTEDESMQNHLESLTATKATNYSLWKVMKNNDNKPQRTACWRCSPQKSEYGMRLKNVPWEIRKRIQEKRRLRRVWHTSRCPSDKTALNKAMFELKTMIKDTDDESMQNHLESLTATKATNYSLWKAYLHLGTKDTCPVSVEDHSALGKDVFRYCVVARVETEVHPMVPEAL
ncbi:Uncharacterized protein OBRU01_15674 [Operophtera brumata]|uniref:Uncharacterized protein n=1 Tax=Operophtera brumata TaxID=104452 RepID=A0A0L7L549_OPEBR|nr:Uncharacterized protein OBRU01_15674 [Operophtera brumata]